jgi:hypothetical protein
MELSGVGDSHFLSIAGTLIPTPMVVDAEDSVSIGSGFNES